MDILLQFIEVYRNQVSAWWYAIGPNGQYYVWLATGVTCLLIWFWLAHRLVRRLLGHRKYWGTWLNQEQFEALLQDLHEREREGKILHYKDAFLLDRYRNGAESKMRKHWQRSRTSI